MLSYLKPIKENHLNLIMLFLMALFAIIVRQPELFINPRFWAEEASIYFQFALDNSWLQSILTPHLGYYSLFNNLVATIAANMSDLKYAPHVTTYSALFIQLTPVFIVLYGSSKYWNSIDRKLLAILIILFTPALTGEIWLNTINSQFYMSVITFLILLEDSEELSAFKKISYRLLLLLCGLTGVVSVFLTPIFLYKAYLKKIKESFIQAAILCLAGCIQFWVFLNFMKTDKIGNRFSSENIKIYEVIINFFYKNLLTPFAGYGTSTSNYLFQIVVILLFALIIFLISKKNNKEDIVYFLGSFTLISGLSAFSALNFYIAERYLYAPSVTLLLYFLISKNNFKINFKFLNRSISLASIFIFISLSIGVLRYKSTMKKFYNPNWPIWQSELSKWKKDNSYEIKIWPRWGENWRLRIDVKE